jgi:hypothetical protein
MPTRKVASFAIAVVSAAIGACSDQSPVAPDPAPGAALQVSPLAQPVDGAGDISFVPGFGGNVTLVAHVTGGGNPAEGGVVIFQFCASPGEFGFPFGQPSAECELGGSARWVRAGTVDVVAGEASLPFHVTRTIGFRFVYRGLGSGIGNFTSLAEDYTPPA